METVGTLSDPHHQTHHLMSDHFIPFLCLSFPQSRKYNFFLHGRAYRNEHQCTTENMTAKEVGSFLQLQVFIFSDFSLIAY